MLSKCNLHYLAVFVAISILTVSQSRSISDDVEENHNFTYYSKENWGASPATDTRGLLTPVSLVVIHHTAIPGPCNTTEQCMESMRSMQRYHMSLNWGDIGYNFCVGSEGGAYEGRGWHVVGIHAGRANNFSVGICLIGDWRYELPPRIQLETTKSLISEGLEMGIISPEYKVLGHSQVMATECPGGALLEEISTWDNYLPGHLELRNKYLKTYSVLFFTYRFNFIVDH